MCAKNDGRQTARPAAGGHRCDLPGAAEENPLCSASGAPAGNASGVGASPTPKCVACLNPVGWVNHAKQPPLRCPACKASEQRQYQKSYRERTRPRIAWGNLTCHRCRLAACTVPRRGPPSKWCKNCLRAVRTEQARAQRERAKQDGRGKPHGGKCLQCGNSFQSCRAKQKYCNATCAHLATRSRSVVACHNCCKKFERCSARSGGRRFCSKECFRQSHAVEAVQCQHCGKDFKRKAYLTPWHGKNKFCSRECYLDNRWGADRPRKQWPAAVRRKSSRKALATALRAKCKHYGVPFDPACTREAVCERDGWVCHNCGIQCHKGPHRFNKKTRKSSPRNAEHDHVVALSVPGSPGNVFSNSQCLCRRCNGRKGKKRGGQLLIAAFAEP